MINYSNHVCNKLYVQQPLSTCEFGEMHHSSQTFPCWNAPHNITAPALKRPIYPQSRRKSFTVIRHARMNFYKIMSLNHPGSLPQVPHDVAMNSIRVSFGVNNTLEDAEFIVQELIRVTATLSRHQVFRFYCVEMQMNISNKIPLL